MKKVMVVLFVLVLLIPVGSGLGAASSNSTSGIKTSAAVNKITIIAGQKKTITVSTGNKSVKSVRMIGPATITGRKQTPTSYSATVKAPASVPSSRTSTLRITFGDNTNKLVTIHIYPQAHPIKNKVNKKIQSQAQKYEKLKSEWLKKSTRMVPKSGGLEKEYFQFDPTKGPVGPNGVPKGKMVHVGMYTSGPKKGQAKWLYNNMSQEILYTAKKSRSRKSTEDMYLIGALVLMGLFELVTRVIIPTYKKYNEESMLYSMSPGQLIWSQVKFW